MYSRVLKFSSILLTMTSLAFANEGGGSAPAEAKKEVKSSEESYAVVQARVQGLETKIHSAEAEIQKLILEKQHAKDPEKVNEIIRQMITLHKGMESNLKEYDQQRTLLKYRYPEKGQVEKREYERIELKSIEDMESQMSLSSSVKRTLKKVRSQYEGVESQTSEAADVAKDAAKRKASEPQPGLIDPVILKK